MNISVCFGLLLCLVAGLNVALSQETSIIHTNCPQRDVSIDESVRRLDGLQTILSDQKLQVEQLFSSMAEHFQSQNSQLLLLLQSQQHIQQNLLVQQQQLDERLQQINKTQELHLQQIEERFSSHQTQLMHQLQSQQQQIQQHHQAQQAQQQQLDERLEQFNETLLSHQQQLDGHLSDLQSQQTQLIESKSQQLDQHLLKIQQKLENASHSIGDTQALPRDCMDVKANGYTVSGVYTIYVDSCQRPVAVYCDMATDGGGWLVFQRRQNGNTNFYRPWADYATGFGNPGGEVWLGNDLLHMLTAGKSYRLRIDMQDFNDTMAYAEYSNFAIDTAYEKYKLTSLGIYSGTAGDSLTGHVGYKFSTFDQDNDIVDADECAVASNGAWWYSNCHSSNLNGKYLNGSHTSNGDGIEWFTWTGHQYSLKFTEMKIKPTVIP